MTVSPVLRVSAGLVFDAGRLLITQRPADKHLGGLWEFPGGKLEEGESYEDCLVRELREELGIDVRVGSMVAAIEHCYTDRQVRIHFFRCLILEGTPQAIECADFVWITQGELDQYVFPPADTVLLNQLKTEAHLWH